MFVRAGYESGLRNQTPIQDEVISDYIEYGGKLITLDLYSQTISIYSLVYLSSFLLYTHIHTVYFMLYIALNVLTWYRHNACMQCFFNIYDVVRCSMYSPKM